MDVVCVENGVAEVEKEWDDVGDESGRRGMCLVRRRSEGRRG